MVDDKAQETKGAGNASETSALYGIGNGGAQSASVAGVRLSEHSTESLTRHPKKGI